MRLTRRYRFSSSHRLYAESLTEEQNAELYGKCANPFGHGHNYVVEVSVRGPVDGRNGRVVNPAVLDEYVNQRVLEVFDQKDMNTDVPEFSRIIPTTENLAADLQRRLLDGWSQVFPGKTLDRIRIEETRRNSFELRTV